MSDKQQQYSIENQVAAIQEYADAHGFVIVETYADKARSGVVAKRRDALARLLADVSSGSAKYKAILVYDVSRWGRYPNGDEAAHYEFLCFRAGMRLHYCAEPFVNDGGAAGSLLKALKRSMAAEFSRELGEKVFRGKARLVKLGFWVGGTPGFGFRRLMVSAEGKPKQLMKPGEQKSFTTDRVILVPGPQQELETVREIFSMASEGIGCKAIARELCRRGPKPGGREWTHDAVRKIVTSPKYIGCNIWNRVSQRLHSKPIHVDPEHWVRKPNAFTAIVSEATFHQAQAALPTRADYLWSDEQILRRVRRLLKAKGRLSETLMMQARGMPSTTTMHNHFGSYRELYEKVGYHPGREFVFKAKQAERSLQLRQQLVETIRARFPEHVSVEYLPRSKRSILLIDRQFMVSVLLCRRKQKRGALRWILEPSSAERTYVTLLCMMNPKHDRVLDYFVLPKMCEFRRTPEKNSWLQQAVRLPSLSGFYSLIRKVWTDRSSLATEISS
jgi:DNA invertase Pin-like site-specific DNA recombinase